MDEYDTRLRVYYHGAWGQFGTFLHTTEGVTYKSDDVVYFGHKLYDQPVHIDTTLAPRLLRSGEIIYIAQAYSRDERMRLRYNSCECGAGQFLRHELDNGHSIIQWWDRYQGDARVNVASAILMKGRHSSEELIEAAEKYFPRVIKNLKDNGVSLVEVQASIWSRK